MSLEAQKRIALAKKEGSLTLDLSNCGLTELPKEVFDLNWLTRLDLTNRSGLFDTILNIFREAPLKNTISNIPADIVRLEKLEILNCSGGYKNPGNIVDLGSISQLKNLVSLDLGYNKIRDLSPLRTLSNLKHLTLKHNRVDNISELKELTKLRDLDLTSNRIEDIGSLSFLHALQTLLLQHNEIKDLHPLKLIKSLSSLSIGFNNIESIKSLSKLTELVSIYIDDNKINDISPLAKLHNLSLLYIRNNLIEDLTPLRGLSKLANLMLNANRIRDISPLQALTNLTHLDISKNQITNLQPILSLLEKRIDFGAMDNPLQNPPAEIANQGKDAILNYFKELEKEGSSELYEAKLLIVGAGGAGKTSLRIKMNDPNAFLPEQDATTRSIDIEPHHFYCPNGKKFTMNMWDFGGQEIYHATHQFFLTKRSLYALVSDTRKEDADFDYWLQVIELLSDKSPVMMIQNELGGRSKDIDFNGLCRTYESIEKPLYKINLGVIDGRFYKLQTALEQRIQQLPHVGQTLPKQWVKIREALGKLAKTKAYVSLSDYTATCSDNGIIDIQQAMHLSAYLHDLGVFLHFKEDSALRNTIVLQNNWATDAVYAVLNDEKVKNQKGKFDQEDMKRIWHDPQYENMQHELAELMVKFELCYPLPDIPVKKYMAPQLLPVERPKAADQWDKSTSLCIILRYAFMPKGIMSRFIVRMHSYLKNIELTWRNGVILRKGVNEALIEEFHRNSKIQIHVTGAQSRELMAIILDEFERINRTFPQTLDMKKLIPCNCPKCTTSDKFTFMTTTNC